MAYNPSKESNFRSVNCGRDLRNWGKGKNFHHQARPEHVSACGDDFPFARHPKSYEREANKKKIMKNRHAARKHKRNQ